MPEAPVHQFETVASTMDEMAKLLAPGPIEPWTAVIADFQTDGRGRSGRSWHAAPGTALLATVYAPLSIAPSRLGMLAVAGGLAVVDVLMRLGVPARLKWPNDLLAGDRKLAGILTVTRIGEPVQTLVGLGVNLSDAPADAVALSTYAPPPPPMSLLLEIRTSMRTMWAQLEAGQFSLVRDDWNRRAAWRGEQVTVPGDDSISGRLLGIDDWGHLRVATAAGEVILTQSEISRGPLPSARAPYT